MYGREYTMNWCYQVETGQTLQRERVKSLMRTNKDEKAVCGRTAEPKDSRCAKAVWALWAALAAGAGAALVYAVVRVFVH